MMEIAIIVQLREVSGDKAGRLAVGFSKWKVENLIPEKKWAEYFFAALRRATLNRARNLQEIERIASDPGPLFREPF
jgi:hypothetical protein